MEIIQRECVKILFDQTTGDIVEFAGQNYMRFNEVEDNIRIISVKSLAGVQQDPKTNGVVVGDDAPTNINEIPEVFKMLKTERIKEIEQVPKEYIYRFYDAGVQQTLTALYVDPATSETKKELIQSIWNWINFVMSNYYKKKKSIEQAFNIGELYRIDTSLDEFTDSKPDVSLRDIMLAD